MRRIAVLAVLFFAGCCAFAQTYGRLDFSIQNGLGQAVPNVNVTVYTQERACGATARFCCNALSNSEWWNAS